MVQSQRLVSWLDSSLRLLMVQKIEPLPKRENKALEKNAASVRETIVPWLWSEKALKELCRQNDIPLNWGDRSLS